MNEFLLALRQFLRSFRCWLIISPWEMALRVRSGKRKKVLGPGFHWKLPIFDSFHLQSVRLRLSPLNKQTVATRSGQAVTVAGSLGYRIDDIELLYSAIHHAEDTISALTRSLIAEYVSAHDLEDCRPERIQAAVNEKLDFSQYGLGGATVYITEFAVAKTYRLIGDHSDLAWGRRLATDVACTSAGDRT
jgi:regulator of protease activity HflC (stomatin/prohibitin superfamily)